MLSAGTTKHHQSVIRWVVPFSHRHTAHGLNHVVVGDLQQTFREFIRLWCLKPGPCHGRLQACQVPLNGSQIELKRKVVRQDTTEPYVEVGDREWTAGTIAGWSWVCSCALRANLQPCAIKATDASAAGRHRFDGQHRSHDADAGFRRFVLDFEAAIESRHIGAGATHVEANSSLFAYKLTGFGETDDSAGRAGQDAVSASKSCRIDQTSNRGHDLDSATGQMGADVVKVGSEHRIQVCVQNGCVAPRHHSNLRTYF